ncbi:hypothetical protein F0P96_14150 [Hymenobacter busanensis]|uniref:Uncharacterized protein n=1 Tax=Hymenobacter busanensis TaxID=2607656 RepID=A0A7L4ZZU2_9BACT|nr:hypothetical protein [Hymenobacter busanensis]KAA9331384.1 hypothetical protein F0P96_14150 [Hymenobacter busanensis]QHJ08537.1 hypothetical protein GUY19_15075 [Hymenobacter busanensis]
MITTSSPATTTDTAAHQRLMAALRRYRWQQLASVLLVVVGTVALLLAVVQRGPFLWSAAGLLAAVALVGLAWWLRQLRRFGPAAAAQRFDRYFPALEDSTGLLLTATPGLLPELQRQRVAERLLTLPVEEALSVPWKPRMLAAALLLAAAVAVAYWPTAPQRRQNAPLVALRFPDAPSNPAPAAPRIVETTVQIVPPAYTRLAAYAAASPSFRCPQGSVVRWRVRTSRSAKKVPELLLAGGQRLAFRPVPNVPLEYAVQYRFTTSALYNIRFAGLLSDDYAVEVMPDRSPELRLLAPAPYTLIGVRRVPEVAVRLQLRDDYGLARARLVLTTAQGSGEAVKFGETTTDLSAFVRQRPRTATATATLRLPALGLTFGDELYVYAEAWDNAGHRTRTDAHLVQWEDTAATGDLASMALGVNPVPVYFRSQRQIIIDTEKLLKERGKLPALEFQQRANSIGEDQKVLRLRYGKFLGEEYEQGETAPRPPVAEEADEHGADDHDHGAEPATEAGLPTAESLTEPYIHRHDDEETADFLEPQVKAKLRAVLSQMWDAELQLRLAEPRLALPYEYRALRLLKEVQQQTRAYVRKSGVDLPPLPEAEKRLTGDVTAAALTPHQAQRALPTTHTELRAALTALRQLPAGTPAGPRETAMLQAAGLALGEAAVRQPGTMLPALRAWRQLMQRVRLHQPPTAAQVSAVEQGLHRLLPVPPAAPTRPAPNPLARRYFTELRR